MPRDLDFARVPFEPRLQMVFGPANSREFFFQQAFGSGFHCFVEEFAKMAWGRHCIHLGQQLLFKVFASDKPGVLQVLKGFLQVVLSGRRRAMAGGSVPGLRNCRWPSEPFSCAGENE